MITHTFRCENTPVVFSNTPVVFFNTSVVFFNTLAFLLISPPKVRKNFRGRLSLMHFIIVIPLRRIPNNLT